MTSGGSPARVADRRFILLLLFLSAGWTSALFLHGPAEILFAPVSLAMLGIVLLLGWSGPPPLSAPSVLLGGWWVYLALGCLWSTAPFVSLLFLFLLLPLPVLALLLPALGEARLSAVFYFMLGGLALLALAAVDQFLFFSRTMGPRIHAPFLDPNNLAAAMNLGLLPSLAIFLTAQDPKRCRVAGALAVLFAAALLATQSRGGLLAALAAGGAMTPFLPNVSRRRILPLAAILAALAVVTEFYGRMVYGHGPSLHLASRQPVNITDRLALWSATARMIALHPLAGTGLGTFSYWYPRFRLPIDRSDGFFAHDDLLQLWQEAGVLAPLLFLAFAGTYLARASQAARRDSGDIRRIAAAASLFAILLQSLVTYDLYLPALLVPLGVILAWGSADEEPASRIKPTSWLYRGCLLLLVLIAAQWCVRAAIGIDAVQSAAAAESHGALEAMGDAVARGEEFAPADDYAVPQFAARWQQARAATLHDVSAPAKGLADIRRAEALNSGFAYLDVTRAQLLADEQDLSDEQDGRQKAKDALETALAHDPLCLEARYFLSALYRANGDDRSALNTMGEALNWPRPPSAEKGLLETIAALCAANHDTACVDQLTKPGDGASQTR